MSFKFIRDHADRWPIRLMCRVLDVSASGYYAWRNRPEGARARANRTLLADVRRLHAEHHGRYGSPRMHAALRAEGRAASRGRVARLMRRHGIRALAGCRFKPCTTDSRHYLPIAPNLLKQEFVAAAPNRVWLADITYIATGEGWLYLATVLDLATRVRHRSRTHGDTMAHRRLVDARPYAHRAAAGRLDDGRAAATTGRRTHLPFRPGQPIRIRSVQQATRCNESQTFNEPHGLLL
jgi:transposase InsO family protein